MPTDKTASQLAADKVDVAILDITAHLEAFMRDVRELQRNALRLRGVAVAGGDAAPPADLVRARLLHMLEACGALRELLNSTIADAKTL
jgi:hypothetical protein